MNYNQIEKSLDSLEYRNHEAYETIRDHHDDLREAISEIKDRRKEDIEIESIKFQGDLYENGSPVTSVSDVEECLTYFVGTCEALEIKHRMDESYLPRVFEIDLESIDEQLEAIDDYFSEDEEEKDLEDELVEDWEEQAVSTGSSVEKSPVQTSIEDNWDRINERRELDRVSNY